MATRQDGGDHIVDDVVLPDDPLPDLGGDLTPSPGEGGEELEVAGIGGRHEGRVMGRTRDAIPNLQPPQAPFTPRMEAELPGPGA